MFNQIASIIALIDPAAAAVYQNKPYNRETIIRAFMKGCQNTKYEDVSFRVWALHRDAIDLQNQEAA